MSAHPTEAQASQLDALRAAVRRSGGTPAGGRMLAEAGLSAQSDFTLDEFQGIPVLKREQLVGEQLGDPEFAGFLTVALRSLPWLGLHSGGELDIAYGGVRGAERAASLFTALGVGSSDVVVNTLGHHLSTASSVFNEGLRRLGATVVPAGPGNTELQVEVLKRTRATVWLGFPSFLAKILRASTADVGEHLRLAILGGEHAPRLRAELERSHDVATREFYGLSIIGPIAFECQRGDGMHVLPDAYLEILDPMGRPVPAGDRGEIVCTPLDHEYAILRLGTGDLARWLDGDCGCGLGTPRISAIEGRVGEAVKVRGVFIHPRDLSLIAEAIGPGFGVRVVIARDEQTRRDTIHLEVMAESEDAIAVSMPDENISERAREAFTARCRLRLDSVAVDADSVVPDSPGIVDERAWEVQ